MTPRAELVRVVLSSLWLAVKVAVIVTLMTTGASAFVYQNF